MDFSIPPSGRVAHRDRLLREARDAFHRGLPFFVGVDHWAVISTMPRRVPSRFDLPIEHRRFLTAEAQNKKPTGSTRTGLRAGDEPHSFWP